MSAGLSDRDRRRLERAGQQAAAKMAAERGRIDRQRRREAPGGSTGVPLSVTGPDGVAVRLSVHRSGEPAGGGDFNGFDNIIGLALAVVLLLVWAVGMIVHWLVFRRGWYVRVELPQRRAVIVRMPSERAALDRLAELADAIRRYGADAVTGPSPR